MPRRRRVSALTALALLLSCVLCQAQNYTRIVVFGDSLSDAGNVARLAQNRYGTRIPGPLYGYTDGRFTDGTDSLPAATLYTGVWVEQLASSLAAKPVIRASLDGGTDYAYGNATTANGSNTTSYGPFYLTVNNLGQQVSDYLATNTTINSTTLFVVWGGANDLLGATSSADIAAAVNNELALIQRLMTAGATEIIVPNLPPLGLTPRLNGNTMAAAQASAAAQAFNTGLAGGLQQLSASAPAKNVHLYLLDTFTLLGGIVAAPATYQIDNARDKSQFATANPDRYLFWDDIHPTTKGHNLLAAAALRLITPVMAATTTTLNSSNLNSNLNSSITLNATVSAATGVPTGTVNFLDGTNVLGSATLTTTGSTLPVASFATSSLSAGTHTLTAVFVGSASFAGSTSAPISQVVTAPALSTTVSPTSLTVTRGSTGTTTLTATPVGGLSGTVTLACGSLPQNMTCSFSPATLTLTGSNTAQTSTLTVGTQTMSSLVRPVLAPDIARNVVATCCLFLVAGIARRRSALRRAGLLSVLLFVSLCAASALAGCGGNDNRVSRGTYTVPVNVTVNGSNSTTNLQVVVQ